MTEEQRKQCNEIINKEIFSYKFAGFDNKEGEFIVVITYLAKEVFNKDITEEEAKEIFNNACELYNISSNSFFVFISEVISGVSSLYPSIITRKILVSILSYFDNGIMLSYDGWY